MEATKMPFVIKTPLIPGDMCIANHKDSTGAVVTPREQIESAETDGLWFAQTDVIPRGHTVLLDAENPNVKRLVERGHLVAAGKDKTSKVISVTAETTEAELYEMKRPELITLLGETDFESDKPLVRMNKKQLVAALCEAHNIEQE